MSVIVSEITKSGKEIDSDKQKVLAGRIVRIVKKSGYTANVFLR